MSSTRKAVRIIWQDAQGGGDATLDFIASSTCEAICMMLDHMEASGLDIGAIDSLRIIGQSGVGADELLAADEARFLHHQAQRQRIQSARGQPCAA